MIICRFFTFSLYFKNPTVDTEPTLNKNLQAFCSVTFQNHNLFFTSLIFSESRESMKKELVTVSKQEPACLDYCTYDAVFSLILVLKKSLRTQFSE